VVLCRQHRQRPGDRRGRRCGEAKVEQLCPRLRQHDVARLQIAMNHASTMRGSKRIGHLNTSLQRFGDRNRTSSQSVLDGLTLEILHDEKIDRLVPADVVKRADVRVIQRTDGSGLALEPLTELRVGCKLFQQHLDCDDAIESAVASLVELAHPPAPSGERISYGPRRVPEGRVMNRGVGEF
jgi:hypothetical protein